MRVLKKISIKFFLLLVLLIALVMAGYCFYMKLPQRLTHYQGLELGMTTSEVMYRKGEPSGVFTTAMPSGVFKKKVGIEEEEIAEFMSDKYEFRFIFDKHKIPKGSNVENYDEWYFMEKDSHRLDVKFDVPNGNVVEIACYPRIEYGCEMVNDIGINSTEINVKKRLGKPSKEVLEGLVKSIEYKNYNIKFYLEKEKVRAIILKKFDNW